MAHTLEHAQGFGCTCQDPAPAHLGIDIRRLFVRAIQLPRLWGQRRRQRQDLAELDDHSLRDIGITRQAAALETDKPFWR